MPGRKVLEKSDKQYEVILVDASETLIERPKKTTLFLFRQEKRHTIKSQIVIVKKSKKIICTSFANGRCYDFNLFRKSKIHVHPYAKIITEKNYI